MGGYIRLTGGQSEEHPTKGKEEPSTLEQAPTARQSVRGRMLESGASEGQRKGSNDIAHSTHSARALILRRERAMKLLWEVLSKDEEMWKAQGCRHN
jgi:hypothetical protein